MKDQHFRADSSRSLRGLQTWLLPSDGNEKLLCVPSRLGCVDCTPLRVENTTALHFHTYSNHILATYRRLCALAHVRTGFSYLPRTNLQSVTGQLCAKQYFLRRVENAQLESCSTADFRPDSTGTTQHALANTKTTLALSFLLQKLNVQRKRNVGRCVFSSS